MDWDLSMLVESVMLATLARLTIYRKRKETEGYVWWV